LRLTVIGCGTSQPQPDTPASGLLVESGDTRLLLDCGQGVISRLEHRLDPRSLSGVIVGHLHADHYIDLVGLRYLFPWGERVADRLPVHLPPGGRDHMTSLAAAISERPTFFDDSYEVIDYRPDGTFSIGELRARVIPGLHYVPAWGVELTDPAGRRLVYAGDTGPNDELVRIARGADLFVCEATLASSAHDDTKRGHLTGDEALDIAQTARVKRTILVHYASARRAALREVVAARDVVAEVAIPDLQVTVGAEVAGLDGAAGPAVARVEVG
jgi:ribonuclease BN (tRNA processing enzyme)